MDDRETNLELVDSSAPVVEPTPEPSPEVPEPTVDVPADPTPEDPTPPAAEPVLYDLPDGRKVDAETLAREFRENFLPEFTRKSQLLADIERGKKDINNPRDDEPAWKKPDYVPKDYGEVIELAKQEAIREMQKASTAEQERIASVQKEVDNQLSEIKTIDPKLDENALFVHANKYGFRDLKAAHKNMADMKRAIVDTEQRTVKNLKTREADPISTGPNSDTPPSDGLDPSVTSQFEGAAEYLAFLKGKK